MTRTRSRSEACRPRGHTRAAPGRGLAGCSAASSSSGAPFASATGRYQTPGRCPRPRTRCPTGSSGSSVTGACPRSCRRTRRGGGSSSRGRMHGSETDEESDTTAPQASFGQPGPRPGGCCCGRHDLASPHPGGCCCCSTAGHECLAGRRGVTRTVAAASCCRFACGQQVPGR